MRYEHGQIKEKTNWEKGAKHGETIIYYENGQGKEKKRCNNGELIE
jgi:antitoxin component YwqK of YwqJK toxin-antitoxin module